MEKALKITFNLDGTGVYYDPAEPPMLDAIIDYALNNMRRSKVAPSRGEEPCEIVLPIKRWRIDGVDGWCASALFPEGEGFETLFHWRKKTEIDRAFLSGENRHQRVGSTKEYNMPVPELAVHKLVGWLVTTAKPSSIRSLLRRNIQFIGKKGSIGQGMIRRGEDGKPMIDVEVIEDDYSLVRDGHATRYLPKADGIRRCRTRPPYWNNHDAVSVCEIGDEYDLPDNY